MTTTNLIDALAAEMANFGFRHLAAVTWFDLLRRLQNQHASPISIRINRSQTSAWLLRIPEISGITAGFEDRIVMWAGTSEAPLPTTILTADFGRAIRSLTRDES
ncbi:hypothetical protein ACIPWF_23135 [Paenarthrobacter sp. NPDC089989]|uniref:hypothetical protein n=1 Tax=unclassified Paenarthrobacter TaxID=2634190 RepID=UPI0038048109